MLINDNNKKLLEKEVKNLKYYFKLINQKLFKKYKTNLTILRINKDKTCYP